MATGFASRRNVESSIPGFLASGHAVEAVPQDIRALAALLEVPTPVAIGGGLFCTVGVLHPDKCEMVLQEMHMHGNRKCRAHQTGKYQADLALGYWELTHQGIAFNSSGRLCDGQHRLSACVKSGVPFPTMITFGVPEYALTVIDNGRNRSGVDAARISGRTLTTQILAALKYMALGDEQRSPMSNSALLHTYDTMRDAVVFIESQFTATIPHITLGCVLGAIGRAYYSMKRERLVDFCQSLKTGIVKEEQDNAVAKLYQFLHGIDAGGGTALRIIAFRKTEAALLSYANFKPLKRLCEAKDELFPLPPAIQARLNSVELR